GVLIRAATRSTATRADAAARHAISGPLMSSTRENLLTGMATENGRRVRRISQHASIQPQPLVAYGGPGVRLARIASGKRDAADERAIIEQRKHVRCEPLVIVERREKTVDAMCQDGR